MTLRAWIVVVLPEGERRDAVLAAAARYLRRFERGQPQQPSIALASRAGASSLVADLRANRALEHPPRFPVSSRHGLLAFDGWLENPDGLARELGHTESTPPDEHLVVEALDRWGDGAFARLAGEYSFAVSAFGERGPTLHAVRDKMGVRPLLHADLPGGWACSNLPGLLASLPGVATEADWEESARFLAGLDARDDATLYTGVRVVQSGHRLLGPPGERRRTLHYWCPASAVLRISRDEAIHAIADAVYTAVRSAAQGYPFVASHLSGGIDSSSVSLVLDDLHRHGRLGPTEAATMSMVYPGRDCDESRYIEAICTQIQLPNHRFEPAFASLASMRRATALLHYPLALHHATAQSALLRAVAERGGCVLTGEGGDELFEPTDHALRRAVLLPRDWWPLAAFLRRRWRDRDRSMRYRGQVRDLLSGLFGEALFARIDALRGRRGGEAHWPIDAAWAARARLHERSRPLPTAAGARTLAMACTRSGAWSIGWMAYFQLSIVSGVEERHPLASSNLVALCNRLPLRLLDGQTPYNRALLRAIHGNRMPAIVLERRDKAEFSAPTLEILRARVGEQGLSLGESVVIAPQCRVRVPDARTTSIWPYEHVLSFLLWRSICGAGHALDD